jgi:hypothetical protein
MFKYKVDDGEVVVFVTRLGETTTQLEIVPARPD